MKVLVFGAGGYIGERLVRHLGERGIETLTAGTQASSAMDASQGRINDDYTLCPGIDTVVYLSQSPHWREGAQRFDHVLAVNCGAAVRLAAMAQAAGVRRFLFASTGTVYQASTSRLTESAPLNRKDWYALSKIFAEEALANLDGAMQCTSLRLFGVYGPRQRGRLVHNLAQRILAGQPVTLGRDPATGEDDGLRSSMTHVDDVVTVLRQLTTRDDLPPVLNLAGEHQSSVRALATQLGSMLDRPVHFESTGRILEGHFVADNSKLRQLVSHKFRSIFEGLATMDISADLGMDR